MADLDWLEEDPGHSHDAEQAARDLAKLRSSHVRSGYADTAAASRETALQDGFRVGFDAGRLAGLRCGQVQGKVVSALVEYTAAIPPLASAPLSALQSIMETLWSMTGGGQTEEKEGEKAEAGMAGLDSQMQHISKLEARAEDLIAQLKTELTSRPRRPTTTAVAATAAQEEEKTVERAAGRQSH